MTVATANLFNFLQPPDAFYEFSNIYSQEDWLLKCQWTKSQIIELDADIIGLQEVFSIDAAEQLLADCGYPHFVTVDTPKLESDYIYSQPVVALASKFPIIQVEAVESPHKSVEAYQIELPKFSRMPISAIVDVPNLGEIAVYVCHLKSQRATEPSLGTDANPVLGQWLSSQQRGWESIMLRLFMEQKYQESPRPTLLVGDMNQPLDSDITGLITKTTSDESNRLQLKDSWDIYVDGEQEVARSATHYHFAKGNTLDYVLLSQEFQPNSQCSIAEVTHYRIQEEHLINPIYERDKQASDHAFVAVTTQFLI